MKYYLLFSIKREALDFERLFLCCTFGCLIKTFITNNTYKDCGSIGV